MFLITACSSKLFQCAWFDASSLAEIAAVSSTRSILNPFAFTHINLCRCFEVTGFIVKGLQLCCQTGCRQPLLVKFADGGTRKKNSFGANQLWIDRSQEVRFLRDTSNLNHVICHVDFSIVVWKAICNNFINFLKMKNGRRFECFRTQE